MFSTLQTLMRGASARSEERLRDTYAVELIDQKIREADTNLKAAKTTLASLIQRKRNETRQLAALETRLTDLTARAKDALRGNREDLATQAAAAMADLENERSLRQETLARMETRVLQLQTTVEAAHRRIVDLKQGAITARAIKREQSMQSRLTRTLAGTNAADEAEALIRRVTDAADPFEQSQILREIDRSLDHTDITDTLAEAGFGAAQRATQNDILQRLRADL